MTPIERFIADHPDMTDAQREILTRFDRSVSRYEGTPTGKAQLGTVRGPTPEPTTHPAPKPWNPDEIVNNFPVS